MIKEHERVVLKSPVPDKGLEAGDVGKVVHVYRDSEAYELGVRRFGWANTAARRRGGFAFCRYLEIAQSM